MFSQANFSTLVIAVVAMAILTALSRALPFLLPDNSPIIRFFYRRKFTTRPFRWCDYRCDDDGLDVAIF